MKTLVFGFATGSDEERRFLEDYIGSSNDLALVRMAPPRPVGAVQETKRWLGIWAYEHPETTYPWRREQARRRVAAMARRLAAVADRGDR